MSDRTTRPEFHEGDLLDGRWVVHDVLPGAMGSVLILSDPVTGVRLAAKTPRLDAALDAASLRRFAIEARNWLTLGAHPHVVEASFFEEIVVDGQPRPFLFLEYVDGPTLGAILAAEERLAIPVVLDVGTGIAWGMAHAHGEDRAGARLVHRDLKPDNVFLTRDRVAKVSDFGIARALDSNEEIAAEGAGLGTPFYAAPEQIRDARAAVPASDVYAYGAVLHHLLTGAPPFPAETLAQLVLKVLRAAPTPPSALCPGVPPELDRLVVACLAKSPGDRPASFSEVLRELSEIREQDALWTAPDGALSCPTCGWLSIRPCSACSICSGTMGERARYAPVSRRSGDATPTLGRSGGGRLVVEGVEVRPRVVREGETVAITALVGNSGSEAVPGVFVPYVLPDRDAFDRPEGHRRGFRGDVPPTAGGAPLRVSWTVRPLQAGTFALTTVRATYRDDRGRRMAVRAPAAEVRVLPRDTLPFVGRESELAELSGCLDAARAGACTLVVGRRGLGKSRLVREVSRRATERGFRVARGRCLDRGVEVRGALKEALRQMLALPREHAGPAETAAALVALLGDAARSSPLLLDFLVAELLARPLPRGESPGVMWARFAEAMGRLRPFLLVLEDVQRDPDVANVAAQMTLDCAHSGTTFAVMMTARPSLADGDAGRDLLARLERMGGQIGCARVLALGPLDDAAVLRLVDAAFAPHDFAATVPWLPQRVASLSGGNPLLVAELLHALRDDSAAGGALVATRDGRWTAAEQLTPEALDRVVPPRIEELVAVRLGQIPEDVAKVARAAGVLGDVFERDLLDHVVDDTAAVDAALRAMEQEGVLRESRDAASQVRFREPLIPEVLARQCRTGRPEDWVRINDRAADWLLARERGSDRQALRVSRHLAAAGRAREAFRWRMVAARRLAARQSYRRVASTLRDAEALLRTAEVSPSAEELTELCMLRAEALRFSGEYGEALRAYARLISAPPEMAPADAELGTIYSRMGAVHEALGQYDDAMRCYATGRALRVAHGLEADVPMSLVNIAGLHLLRGEISRAELYIERAISQSVRADSPRPRARAHALQARVLVGQGRTAAARAAVREALRWARVARDRTTSADAWNVLGMAGFADGRPTRALAHFVRALRLRQEIGDLAAVAGSWNNVAAVHEVLGDRAEALRGFERAVDLYRRIGSARGLGVALTNVARMQLDSGHPRRAAPLVEEACEVLDEAGDPVMRAGALAESVRLAVATTRPDSVDHAAAGEALGLALRLVGDGGDHDTLAAVAEARAAWHASRGETDAAIRIVREAVRIEGLEPRRRVGLLSVLAELSQDPDAAQEATRLAEAGSGPRVRARALVATARVLRARGDDAGAAPLLRRAAGLLRQVAIEDPLLLSVLRETREALAASDPAAAEASARRADELGLRLRKRGFVGL